MTWCSNNLPGHVKNIFEMPLNFNHGHGTAGIIPQSVAFCNIDIKVDSKPAEDSGILMALVPLFSDAVGVGEAKRPLKRSLSFSSLSEPPLSSSESTFSAASWSSSSMSDFPALSASSFPPRSHSPLPLPPHCLVLPLDACASCGRHLGHKVRHVVAAACKSPPSRSPRHQTWPSWCRFSQVSWAHLGE